MGDATVRRNATGGAQGTDYQIKLLLNCLLRSPQEEFELDTELRNAGNWDDVVYKQNGSYRLFQVKHKANEDREQLRRADLLSTSKNKPYALFKYYQSYQTIRQNFNVKDLVLFTNIDLAEDLKSSEFLEEIKDDDALITFEKFSKTPARYRLKNNGNIIIESAKRIIATDRREDNHLGRYAVQLRDILLSSGDITGVRGLQSRLRDKVNALLTQEERERLLNDWNSIPSNDEFDRSFEEFRKRLVLAVNQPNERQLSELIMNSLDSTRLAKATFSYSIKSAEAAYRTLETRMRDFYKYPENVASDRHLSLQHVRKWKSAIEKELGKLFKVGCYYEYHKKLDYIEFDDRYIDEIINSLCIRKILVELEAETLLLYIQSDEPILTAIKVRSALKRINNREQFLFTSLTAALDTEHISNDCMSLAVRMVIVDEKGETVKLRKLIDLLYEQIVTDPIRFSPEKRGFIVIISDNSEAVEYLTKTRRFHIQREDFPGFPEDSKKCKKRKQRNEKDSSDCSATKRPKEADFDVRKEEATTETQKEPIEVNRSQICFENLSKNIGNKVRPTRAKTTNLVVRKRDATKKTKIVRPTCPTKEIHQSKICSKHLPEETEVKSFQEDTANLEHQEEDATKTTQEVRITWAAVEVEPSNISWKVLSGKARNKIKSTHVEFQGREVTLSQFDVIEQVITAKTLVQLVENVGVEMKIGAQHAKQFHDQNRYVQRTMNCRLLNGEALKTIGKERFCLDQSKFKDDTTYWIQPEREQEVLENMEQEEEQKEKEMEEEEQESELQQPYFLKKSRGNIEVLRKFIDEKRVKRMEERSSLDKGIKIAIISDLAGMGKSAILNSFWCQIKDQDATRWIVKLDLNDEATTKALDIVFPTHDSKTLIASKEFVGTFLNIYYKNMSPLEKILFSLQLERGDLIVMLDSFDEIRTEYQKKVLLFLRCLRETNISQLWITTRPHYQETLEDELGQFSFTLLPFSREDQIKYLYDYWKSFLKDLSVDDWNKLQDFAEKLIDLLGESSRGGEKNFTGVPLQCRMLAESFQYHLVNEKNQFVAELPKRLNLTDLYELFWRRKCQMFLKDKGKAHGASSFAQFVEDFFERTCALLFEKLALNLQFSAKDFQFLWQANPVVENLLTPLENQIHSFGLTMEAPSRRRRFIHQTVAEYFVARFLVDHLLNGLHSNKTKFIEFLFDKVLADEKHFHVTRCFMNGLLPENTRSGVVSSGLSVDKVRNVIVVAAKDGHHNIVSLILQGYWSLAVVLGKGETDVMFGNRDDISAKGLLGPDKEGWTPVHWAAARGNELVLKVIFEFASKRGINTTRLLAPDVKFGETPMHRASLMGQCQMMRFILQYLDPRSVSNYRKYKKWGWRLLRWQMLYSKRNWTSALDADTLLGPDKNSESTLHRAASQGNAESVKIILDAALHFKLHPNRILGRGLYGETPLHRAALRGSEQILAEIFIYLKKCNTSPVPYLCQDHYGETPFHRAASRGRHKVIALLATELRRLQENPLDFFNRDWDGMSPLNRAAENGFHKVVEEILKIYKCDASESFIENNLLTEWTEMTWAAANGHTRALEMIFDFLQQSSRVQPLCLHRTEHHLLNEENRVVAKLPVENRPYQTRYGRNVVGIVRPVRRMGVDENN